MNDIPLQITVRDIPASPALETNLRKRTAKLSHFYDRINSCRIVVELPQKHKHQGKLYNVRIDVTVPGKELVATHKHHEDLYVAVRDAFNAIARQLEEYGRKRHGHVKTHHDVLHGNIVRLVTGEGYGFIQGRDGHEYYFSMTNVGYPSFEQLAVGDSVEYIAVPENDGRQAHHVIREKHHHEIA